MGVFQNRKYRPSGGSSSNSFGARYRALMAKRPFLLFGLPFLSVIVAASFVLTPATAIRYERHDRKVRQMTREEELGVGRAGSGRKVDIREEYYVRFSLSLSLLSLLISSPPPPPSISVCVRRRTRATSFFACLHNTGIWCLADGAALVAGGNRDWQPRISTTGSRSGSRG